MIHLYCKQRCTSSPKAIQWFNKYRIDIQVKPMGQISKEEIITALASTDNGISELLKNSNYINEEESYKIYLIKKMKLNQAIDFIKINPELLKSPIIIERNKVLIGFSPDQIRIFLPSEYRRKSLFKRSQK